MSKRIQNDVRMAEAVYDVLDKYKTVWSQHKGFDLEVQESTAFMQQMEESRMLALSKSNGPTSSKADVRVRVTTMCVELAGRAGVYARKQKNIELRARLHARESVLGRMAGNKLLDKLKNVHEALATLGKDVEMYDVGTAQIGEFKKLIAEFRQLIPRPRVVQVGVKNYNRKSADIMKLIKESFDNMQDLLSSFKNTDFTNEFISARMVIDLKGAGKRKEKEDNKEDVDITKDSHMSE